MLDVLILFLIITLLPSVVWILLVSVTLVIGIVMSIFDLRNGK